MAEPAQVNVSRQQFLMQRAADSTRDFMLYMAFVHALIPSEPQFIVAERLMYGDRRELILGPPGCGKSTVLTAWIEWSLGRDPNYRWLILSEIINRRATEHVRNIGDTLESNEKYHLCFGQLKGREEWSSQSLRLRKLALNTPPPPWPWLPPRGRDTKLTWPNVSAAGWRAGITGTRADAILADDYVSERTSNSKLQTERARSIFGKVVSTRLSPSQYRQAYSRERIICLGQRWMPRDFYGLLESAGVSVYDNNPQRTGLHVLDAEVA